jgi:hypothetical protein
MLFSLDVSLCQLLFLHWHHSLALGTNLIQNDLTLILNNFICKDYFQIRSYSEDLVHMNLWGRTWFNSFQCLLSTPQGNLEAKQLPSCVSGSSLVFQCLSGHSHQSLKESIM